MNNSDKALDIILDHTASAEWEDVCDMNWTTSEVQELLMKALNQVKNNVGLANVRLSLINECYDKFIELDGDEYTQWLNTQLDWCKLENAKLDTKLKKW